MRAHPPGVALEASEECLIPSRAIVCYVAGHSCVRAAVLRLVPFRSRFAFKPPSLARVRSIRILPVFIIRPSRIL
jgi:hypothetical protein